MVFKDLAGIGPLQESLERTNQLLAQVLAELRTTNGEQLPRIAALLDDES